VCTCRCGTVCVHADLEQCVYMQIWNSVCTCRCGTVCVHADLEQCVHMQMWNSVCTCRCGTVCAHADVEQCAHMQIWNSVCTCSGAGLLSGAALPDLHAVSFFHGHFSATTNSPVYHTCWSVLLCGAPGHANGPPATAAAAQAAAIVSASRGPIMHDQCTTVSM
jgi:hypothetical protein